MSEEMDPLARAMAERDRHQARAYELEHKYQLAGHEIVRLENYLRKVLAMSREGSLITGEIHEIAKQALRK